MMHDIKLFISFILGPFYKPIKRSKRIGQSAITAMQIKGGKQILS